MDFSSTRVVNNWQRKSKDCNSCKCIDVLNHQACNSNCLGESRRENNLIAQKINSSLKESIGAILSRSLNYEHTNLESRLAKLESGINECKLSISRQLPVWKEFSSLSDKVPKRAQKESKIMNFEQRIKNLNSNLDRLEFDLSIKAAEHYDNFDRASILPLNESGNEDKQNLRVYYEELKEQKKTLDELGIVNNKHQEAIQGWVSVDAGFIRNIIDFRNDFGEGKQRTELLDGQLKRIEEIQKSLGEKIQAQLKVLKELKEHGDTMKRKQESIKILKANDLMQAAESIFKGRRYLKKCQEFAKTSLVSQLKLIKTVPELQSRINSFSVEISRYQ